MLFRSQAWAQANLPPEQVESFFNSKVGTGEPQDIEAAFEWLKNEMETHEVETNEDSDESEFDEVDEWYDSLSDEVLDETVEAILDMDITADEVQRMGEMATQYDEDSAQNAILMAGQLVGLGRMTIEDAIDEITETFGESRAAAAYFELSNRFN